MITYNVEKWYGQRRIPNKLARMYKEGTCLSTDTKPTDLDNGSKLLEIDTSKVYVWDLENEVWREWS